MGTGRLEAFSDGVIAIIITIMVLELKTPADASFVALVKLWPTFMSYLLSFILVAIYWVNHHHLIHLLRRVDGPVLWLNINLLFWMSLTPFATAYLGEQRAAPIAVALYGGLQAMCCLAFALLRYGIARLWSGEPVVMELHRRARVKILVAFSIYVVSVPLALVTPPLALILIGLPAAMYFMPSKKVEAASSGQGAGNALGPALVEVRSAIHRDADS